MFETTAWRKPMEVLWHFTLGPVSPRSSRMDWMSLFLGHVNGAIGFMLNVNSKEVFNVILCGDVQPCGFNFLDDVI